MPRKTPDEIREQANQDAVILLIAFIFTIICLIAAAIKGTL